MLEMKITIAAPDLVAAINNLAEAYAKNNSNPLEKAANALKSAAEKTKTVAEQPVTPPQGTQAPQTTAASVTTAPIANPTMPVPGVPLSATPAPTAAPVAHAVPVAQPAPAVTPAANPVPAPVPTAAPQYTLDMIATAGSALIDAGKMDQLMGLLAKFGVASLTELSPNSYGAVASELRALGAAI